MSKCPKCNTDLKLVYGIEHTDFWYEVRVADSGLDYDLVDESSDGICSEYKCPNCREVIATNEEEVKKLL